MVLLYLLPPDPRLTLFSGAKNPPTSNMSSSKTLNKKLDEGTLLSEAV